MEFVNQKDREIIHLRERGGGDLENYKTRKKKLAAKDIQDIVSPSEERHIFQEIFDNKNAKLMSINYFTLHNLSPITGNSHCFSCRRQPELPAYIFLACQYLTVDVREETRRWPREVNCHSFDRKTIIDMSGIQNAPKTYNQHL